MTSFFIALLLLLRVSPGEAEAADEEEITDFLYDYASRFSDYLYATVEYYSDNTTLIPTMYPDEELQESLGPSLRCHLPLLVLLALLRLLL
ncbi:hypothetical protein Q9233_012661 [Columba guinea]|nr:hypothetical protein Q9233_012661 [Columba guinea]